MGIKQWPAALRAAGIQVREVNGFPGNDRGRPMPNRPAAVFWHHDATPKGSTPGALGWITQSYNAGSPSAQIWVDYAGVWYFVGSGYASHAGVTRGPLDSSNSIGIETDHTGPEVMSAALLRSMQVGLAAVCRVEGRRADFVTFHKIEASPRGRKIDPYFGGEPNDASRWDGELAQQRSIINGIIDGGGGGGGPVTKTPEQIEEEELMAAKDEILGRIAALENRIFDRKVGSQSIYDEIRYATNDVLLPAIGGVDAWIFEDKGGLHVFYVDSGEQAPIPDPQTLQGIIHVLQQSGRVVKYWPGGDVSLPGAFGRRDQDASVESAEPPKPPAEDKRYTVVAGDTLGKIAGAHGVSVEQIVQWNGLANPDQIEVGQSLIVGKA
jgi:LysM repeat protein